MKPTATTPAHLGLQDDVRVAREEVALVALVVGWLLHDGELLYAPDLEADLLADAGVAWVEHSGHARGWLESCGRVSAGGGWHIGGPYQT